MGGFIVSKFMRSRMPGIPEEHFNIVHAYLYQILWRSGSGEHALQIIFEAGLIPETPIIEDIMTVTDTYLS